MPKLSFYSRQNKTGFQVVIRPITVFLLGGTLSWTILNLKAGYIWKMISLNAGLQNIFNLTYRIHGYGIDGYGRSFWLTLGFEI